jgi:hypothetical protein
MPVFLLINPFRSYVGPCLTLWFSCSWRFSWSLTFSNPIFLPPAYSPALIYFGWERCWWITCNYPTVLKEKNINRKSTTCASCWLKSVLHEEKHREQENHNVGWSLTLWNGIGASFWFENYGFSLSVTSLWLLAHSSCGLLQYQGTLISFCPKNMVMLPSLWVICSNTYHSYTKLWIILNTIYNVIFM